MVISMSYYGLTLSSVELSGDIYINFFLSALMEIPAYIICLLVRRKWPTSDLRQEHSNVMIIFLKIVDGIGRKTTIIGSLAITGSCCIAAAHIDTEWAVTTLTLIGEHRR